MHCWPPLTEQPWQEPSYIGRRVQVYGYNYTHTRGGIHRIGDLPSWASDLTASLVRDGLMPAAPEQLIVNEYPAGTGIPAHVDHVAFDDTIVSISLGSTCVMDFVRGPAGPVRSRLPGTRQRAGARRGGSPDVDARDPGACD